MGEKIKNFFTKDNLKKLVTGKSLSEKMSLIAAGVAFIVLILDVIYTSIYSQYQDYSVVLFLLAGMACWIAYFLVKDQPILNWLGVVGIFFAGIAMALFLTNSLNIWQDTWGNIAQNGVLFGTFNFFNSEGGPVFPVIIIVFFIGMEVCGIISAFTSKKKSGNVEVVDSAEA